jgi:enoyl-CoA hydratase
MSEEKVIYEVRDGIGYIIINNQEKMNSMSIESTERLSKILDLIEDDEKVKAVIITGKGEKAFMSGQDINNFQLPSLQNGKKMIRTILQMLSHLEKLNKPVIAAVNGLALGGGTEILLACDIVIASEKARFGLPEAGVGVAPIWGIIRLATAVGRNKAKELMMTGDIISAEEAKKIGLVSKVVAPDELLSAAEETARKIMSKAPLAIQLIKHSVDRKLFTEGETLASQTGVLMFKTEDFKEGVNAFQEKRKPVFGGM